MPGICGQATNELPGGRTRDMISVISKNGESICGGRGWAMAFALILVGTALAGEDGPTPDGQAAREPSFGSSPDSVVWNNPFVAGADSEQIGAISPPLVSAREDSGNSSAGSSRERRAIPKIPAPIAKKRTGAEAGTARLNAESDVDRFIAIFDRNRNGDIERDEFLSSGDHAFGWFDRDTNGVISRREVRLVQARLRGDARRRARFESNRKPKAIPAISGSQAGKKKATTGGRPDRDEGMEPDMAPEMGSIESSEMMLP